MTKFKVGDKVRITGKEGNCAIGAVVGSIAEIISEFDGSDYKVKYDSGDGVANTRGWIAQYNLEHASPKPTKNQRITTLEQNVVSLESEVAELKAKVEALEALPKPTEVAEMFALAQLEAQIKATERSPKRVKPKSPNEQRKAIIAEAKAFVNAQFIEGNMGVGKVVMGHAGHNVVEFVVNSEKRTVVALLRLAYMGDVVKRKGIAKCAPDDVFNADIGKAIALGRALGLDVSRFEQAVKPTEVVVGHVIRNSYTGSHRTYTKTVKSIEGSTVKYATGGWDYDDIFQRKAVILSDTEAKY